MTSSSNFKRFHPHRTTPEVRSQMAQVSLHPGDFILPLFVITGKNRKEIIPTLEGVFRWSVDRVREAVEPALALGIEKFLLFGVIPDNQKTPLASGSREPQGPIPQALTSLRRDFPQAILITDVCLCAYTDHGHCGLITPEGVVENDSTLPLLAQMALAHAKAGAHWVAPSAMMDGQVQVIRRVLDQEGYPEVKVLGYSAKFSSHLYGPFRDAAGSAPAFGDRKTYQMDYRVSDQALEEIQADLEEGAEAVMVKPAHWYQDIIARGKLLHPQALLAAYQVSGEFMMIHQGAKAGLFPYGDALLEALFGLKRSGADWIITYGALDAANLLGESRGGK